jgi:hypothetical protein
MIAFYEGLVVETLHWPFPFAPVNSSRCGEGRVKLTRLLDVEPERRMREALATVHGYAAGEHSDEVLRDMVTNFLLAGRDTNWRRFCTQGKQIIRTALPD